MIKWIIGLLLVGCQFTASAHKFYVSISQINYNEKGKTLEVALKLFTDDLEYCASNELNKSIKISKEHLFDKEVNNYLTNHFTISINGESKEINYLGKEIEVDVTWCYLEITDVENINTISISNTLFISDLAEQKNLIQLSIDSFEESTILRKNNPSITYQLK